MANTQLITNLTRSFHKAGLIVKKHSPEILAVAGTIGTVATVVAACKATTKLDGILEKSKEDIDKIHYATEHPEELEEEYTPEDSKKDLTIVYAQTGLKLVKLYGPAVLLGTASLAALLGSNQILRKRNAGLIAAYTVVDKGFKEYRERVVERFGKELDRELRYNIKAKEVTETIINEDGSETTETKTVKVADISKTASDYRKCFDETCMNWTRDREYNYMFLNRMQDYFNERLQSVGHVFLNEVYKELGFQRTPEGQHVGWIYDKNDPTRQNYIDFGMFDLHDPDKRAFVNGLEPSIWLDFQPDGVIHELVFRRDG